MNFIYPFLLSITLMSALGCSSMNKKTLLGAAIGGTIGTVIGHQQNNQFAGFAAGSALGALIGTDFGNPKTTSTKEMNLKIQNESDGPKLLSPKVRKVWIPAKIEGDKFYDGHYMYVIEKQTTWSN